MNVKRTEAKFVSAQCSFIPDLHVLNEDIEKISLAKALLLNIIRERERNLVIIEKRISDEKTKLHICDHENRAISVQISDVEAKISEVFLLTQEAEAEALQTVRENRIIKRKIIALRKDFEEQGRIIKKARETMEIIGSGQNKKPRLLLPKVST